jgi:hypothetical protein
MKSFNEYGIEYHSLKILHELPKDVDQPILDTYEILYISQYKDCGIKMLNIQTGGINYTRTEGEKEKIRKSLLGHRHTEESKQKMREKRNSLAMSEETKRKISDAKRGFKHSEETKKKMSLALIGNKRTAGKNLTEEHKEKIKLSWQKRRGDLGN